MMKCAKACLIETHINFTSLVFALALCNVLLAFQELLSVLVQFQGSYLAVRWVEWNLHLSPVGLVLSYFVHMDGPFLSVDTEYFTLLALVVAFYYCIPPKPYLSSRPPRRPSSPA